MSQIETFRYDDEIVRKFLLATIVWGVVGLLLGVIIATQLVFWDLLLKFHSELVQSYQQSKSHLFQPLVVLNHLRY